MPIVIKELFPSDPLSEALEKINFNFDQLILAGGGPPGPIGPQGVPGIPGPQGERGDHWQVGTTAPTADHGPNYGSLKDFDFWISATGQVYYWNSGASAWTSSGTNLTGPQGAIGATGGSFEMGMYQGSSGNANTPGSIPSTGIGATNYTPGIGGATTVASGGVDFIIPINIEKNSFFLGDKSWAYSKLNNFGVYDTLDSTNIQRLTPKQVIIQTEIDSTGLGGLTIGAYGATSSIGATQSLYEGDSTAITDALNFFTAGFAFNQPGGQFSHIFKMRTGTINLEIQAGDENFTGLSKGKTPDLILRSNRTLISDWQSNPRVAFGATSTTFRERVAIGYTTVPTFDVIAGATSVLDVSNHARVRGNLLIGDLSGTASKALIGYARTIDGSSNLEFYSNSIASTTPSFSITRLAGANGIATIEQLGTGRLNISSVAAGSWIDLVGNNSSGYIRFSNSINTETMRVNVANQRVGINVTSPNESLEVGGNIHVSGGDRTIFNRSTNSLAFGTSNTEWMRILSTGLIGIGTTTPTDKLEIGNGNIAINHSSLASQGTGFGLKFENGTSAFSSIVLYRGSASNNLGLSFQSSPSGTPIEAMRLHPSGVISIGNSTAHLAIPTTYRVHIQDNTAHSLLIRSNVSSSGAKNNILFQKQNSTFAVSAGTFIGGLSFGGYDGSGWSIGSDGGAEILSGVPFTWSALSKPAYVSITTTANLTNFSVERFRIQENGKIYIGQFPTVIPLGYDIEIQGNGNKIIGVANSNPGLAGGSLDIRSGMAGSGSNLDGGDLNLYTGQATGNGLSSIKFYGLATTGAGTALRGYVVRAEMSELGNWAFGGHSPTTVSKIDLDGSLRMRNVSSNNTALTNGLRLNSDNDTYEAEIRPYQGSDSTRLGLSFRTTDAGVGTTERMRIMPNGDIQLMRATNIDSGFSYVINATIANGPTVWTIPTQNYDRIFYLNTQRTYGQHLNGPAACALQIWVNLSGNDIFFWETKNRGTGTGEPNAGSFVNYSFIIPAGQPAIVNFERFGGIVTAPNGANNTVEWKGLITAFGKQ